MILIEIMFICLNDICEWIHFVLFAVVFLSISIIRLLSFIYAWSGSFIFYLYTSWYKNNLFLVLTLDKTTYNQCRVLKLYFWLECWLQFLLLTVDVILKSCYLLYVKNMTMEICPFLCLLLSLIFDHFQWIHLKDVQIF